MLEGHLVAVRSEADEARGDEVGDDRLPPPLLPLVDVGQVHLDDRDRERLERVVDRPRVVRERAGVDDDRRASTTRADPRRSPSENIPCAYQPRELSGPQPAIGIVERRLQSDRAGTWVDLIVDEG